MRKFILKSCDFLSRHIWLWWLLNLTWGLPCTLIGFFMAVICEMLCIKSENFGPCVCYIFGDNWGGYEGVFFIFVADNMSDEWTAHTKIHELGHSFQNAIFGPFMLFISIASAIRYWHQRIREHLKLPNKDYDSIWFEGTASDGGMIAAKNLHLID